jgi:hypothetical protein
MQIDKVLLNLRNYDYLCDEAIQYLEDNILGKGYTYRTCVQKIAQDPLISDDDKRIWLSLARRLKSEPTAIRLGIDAVPTETYRVIINEMSVKQGSLDECRQFRKNLEWVKFSNIVDGIIEDGNVNNFNRAETIMGDVYTTKNEIESLNVRIEQFVEDITKEYAIWEAFE